tara:strand:+ start:53 stop:502 length:450 start_codon:yes stop_codon:yes gene_type:complete
MKKYITILFLFPFCSFSQELVKNSNYFDDLTEEETRIIIYKGTEKAGTGLYNNYFDEGIYICKACNNPLFESNSKFRTDCGWPAFDDEINGAVSRYSDFSFGLKRIEICCANCKGHLGHIFEGEELTSKNIRYCVNSLSIKFISSKNLK